MWVLRDLAAHLSADTWQLREFYKDRLALEREYAVKLQGLVKKATDKKSKIETHLVFGKDPTKTWQASDLQSKYVSHYLMGLTVIFGT
jgi:formin-binding protein 1